MGIKQTIEQDLKIALLAGEKEKATVLRGLKSVILNAEIASNKRDTGLDDAEVIQLLKRESKMRTESAELYIQGNSQDRADKELREKVLIEVYLPAQMPEADVAKIVDEVIAGTPDVTPQMMGQIIGKVKQKIGPVGDGATIARLVKERLN